VDFALFILVTAILRIRPTDIIPGLEEVHLYEITILSCLVVSLDKMASELTAIFAGRRPITSFMLGMLVVIPISDLVNGDMELAVDQTIAFIKIILYYLLAVGIVNSPRRLKWLVIWLVLIDLVPTCLSLLDYHGFIYIKGFDHAQYIGKEYDPVSGGMVEARRLAASGLFGDPNDFAQILNTGVMFCLGFLMEKGAGLARVTWLAPLAASCFALWKTGSRGGLLGTFGGLAILFWNRFGLRKMIIFGLVLSPMFLYFVSGRMAQLSASQGTGLSRVEIWHGGFVALRHSPVLIGVGANRYVETVGRATHNGFLCAFVELGFIGGACFLGTFYYALSSLWRLQSSSFTIQDPVVRRLCPYVFAATVSFVINEMSLTHPLIIVTYMMLALANACVRLADPQFTRKGALFSGKLVLDVMKVSAIFVIGLFIFTKYTLHW
jgi:hypothetical protein